MAREGIPVVGHLGLVPRHVTWTGYRAIGRTAGWSGPGLRPEIDIAASASLVWGILTDFGSYRRWNPYMRAVSGQSQVGNSIEITQDVVAFGASTKPVLPDQDG